MSFLDKFLLNFDCHISNGGEYTFAPFGDNLAYWEYDFDEDPTVNGRGSVSVVFNSKTKKIYQYSTYDSNRSVEYVWYDSSVRKAALLEADRLNKENPPCFTTYDTDDEDDIFAKAHAIRIGMTYENDVVIDIDMDTETFLACSHAAHKMDVSMNGFLKHVMLQAIELNKEKSETE